MSSLFILAVITEIAVLANLAVFRTAIKALRHNQMDGIVKGSQRVFYGGLRIRERYSRHAGFFAGVVDMHSADLLSSTTFNQVSVDV